MKLEWETLSVQMVDKLQESLMHSLVGSQEIMKIDLENINKIDICAIQVLLSLQKTLNERESSLLLMNCTTGVMDALALCGCLELFEYADE